MRKLKYLAGLVALLITTIVIAQEPPAKELTLREAVLLSLRYNPAVQDAELQRIIDKFSLRTAQWQFELQYALTGSANYTNTRSNGTTTETQSYNLTPSASLETPVGGTINVNMPNNSDGTYYNPQVAVSINQPLMRGYGTEVAQAALYDAYEREKINKLTMKGTIINTITQVINDYRQVVQNQNNLKIQQLALKDAIAKVNQNKIRIKAGVMAENENVQYESQIAIYESAVVQAENSVAQSILTLLNDIGLSPDTKVNISNDISLGNEKIPSLEESKCLALQNDVGYQTSLINQKINERALLVAIDSARAELNLSLDYTTGGGTGGGQNAGIESLFNGANNSTSATLNLSVPIDDLTLEQSIINAKIALKKDVVNIRAAKWKLEASVMTALTNLKLQKEQIEYDKRARDLAQQSVDVAEKKLQYGRVSGFEVTSLLTTLNNANVTLLNTEIAYLTSLNNFHQLLGITPDVWHIKIRY